MSREETRVLSYGVVERRGILLHGRFRENQSPKIGAIQMLGAVLKQSVDGTMRRCAQCPDGGEPTKGIAP